MVSTLHAFYGNKQNGALIIFSIVEIYKIEVMGRWSKTDREQKSYMASAEKQTRWSHYLNSINFHLVDTLSVLITTNCVMMLRLVTGFTTAVK